MELERTPADETGPLINSCRDNRMGLHALWYPAVRATLLVHGWNSALPMDSGRGRRETPHAA